MCINEWCSWSEFKSSLHQESILYPYLKSNRTFLRVRWVNLYFKENFEFGSNCIELNCRINQGNSFIFDTILALIIKKSHHF